MPLDPVQREMCERTITGLQVQAGEAYAEWEGLRTGRPDGQDPAPEELRALGDFIRADHLVRGAEWLAGALGYVSDAARLPEDLLTEGVLWTPERRPTAPRTGLPRRRG